MKLVTVLAPLALACSATASAWPCDTHDVTYYRDQARGAPPLSVKFLAVDYCTMESVRTAFADGKGNYTEDDAKRCSVEKEKVYDAVASAPSSSAKVQALEQMNACAKAAPPRK